MVYSNTAVYGGNEYSKIGHSIIDFYMFEAHNDLFEV